jgi:hypothetical protein
MTGQTVISEVGLDMIRWPSENHFASWLGLCPSNGLSGGRLLKKRTRKVLNRAATAFRMAASTLRTSQSYLGAKFRRLRSRLGPPKAITAMAAPWPSSSTACSSSDKTTWIVEPSSMSKDSETSSFNTYRKGCSTRLASRCITGDSKVSFWRVQRDNPSTAFESSECHLTVKG